MRYKNIFGGFIIIIIGVLFILRNIGVIDLSWWYVWKLWPLILVFIGISVLPIKDVWKLIISFIILLIAVLLITIYGLGDSHIYINGFSC